MSLVIIVLAALCLIELKIGIKEPVEDYISPSGTLAVKGLFVAIVFLSHLTGYVDFGDGPLHILLNKTCSMLNQLMVVPFFFYSGYGVGISAMTKKNYGKNLPAKRILPLFLRFAFAILLYLIAAAVIGARYSTYDVISAFIGWESVGNSNWFIFATFALYAASFIGFTFFKNKKASFSVVTLLAFVYIGVMIGLKRPLFWYDTVLAFPLGMWFALYKDRFDTMTEKFPRWFGACAVCSAGFFVFWYLFKITEGRAVSIPIVILKSLFFALCVVLVTRRFSPRNKILSFFGKHVFEIYILQRLPMLLLEHFVPAVHPVLFAAISFAVTVALAFLYGKLIVPEKLLANMNISKQNKIKTQE